MVLPVLISKYARMQIRSRNKAAIRIWLSLLYMYKSFDSGHKTPDFMGIMDVFHPSDDFHFMLNAESLPPLYPAEELFLTPTADPFHQLSIASFPIDTLWCQGLGESTLRNYGFYALSL